MLSSRSAEPPQPCPAFPGRTQPGPKVHQGGLTLAQRGQDLLSPCSAPASFARTAETLSYATQPLRARSLAPLSVPVSPKPRSVPPSQPSRALPNAGCEFLLSDHTSANKKGIKDSCAQVSNSPTCLLGQPLPLLLAGSTGSPRTLPSISDSTPGREELGRGGGGAGRKEKSVVEK